MPLLLGQLIYTSFPGVGFQVLASDQMPPEIQQAFLHEVVQRHWDTYDPPGPDYRAVYLYQVSPLHCLWGWLYNDGPDELERSHVPYFLGYHLAAPLGPEQLRLIFACLERGPVMLGERQHLPQSLGNLLVAESCHYPPARPGMAIPADLQASCRSLLEQGQLLDLFLPSQAAPQLQPAEAAATTMAIAPYLHPPTPVNKLALLIGVSDYGPGFSPLPGVEADLASLTQVLQDPAIGGFTAVRSLLNPDPQAMAEAIEGLFSECDRQDLVLLYFSGHGIRDSQGQVLLTTHLTRRTAQKKLVRSTLMPLSFLHDVLQECPSEQQIVILDCCFSRASSRQPPGQGQASVDLKTQLAGKGRVVMTAAIALQSTVHKSPTGSTYTFYLVEGLATGAADLDRDGVIAVQEWHEYSQRKLQTAIPATTPRIYDLSHPQSLIPLAQSPLDDPKFKYRQAVEHYAQSGAISLVNRIVLEALQSRLTLAETEAIAIEQSVLKPHQDYQAKLQEYAQTVVAAMQQEYPLGDRALKQCKRLQQNLGLTDEDVRPIETQVNQQLPVMHLQPHPTLPAFPDQNPALPPSLLQQRFQQAIVEAPLHLGLWLRQWPGWSYLKLPELPPLQRDRCQQFWTSNRWRPTSAWGLGILGGVVLIGSILIWQTIQTEQRLQAIARAAQQRDYETCKAEVNQLDDQARQSQPAQQWLEQCQAGLAWKLAQIQPLAQQTEGTVWSLAFSPDGQTLASGGDDGSIRLWDLNRGQIRQEVEGHGDRVWSLAFSPDGQTLASSSGDQTIKLWQTSTGKLLQTLRDHRDTVWAIAFSPDGRTLVSGSGDGTIKLWQPGQEQPQRTLGGDLGTVRTIAIDPEGQILVGGGLNGVIKVWQLTSGKFVRTLTGHSDRMISLAMSRDRQILISGSADRSIKRWDLESGQLRYSLNNLQGWANTVALSPNQADDQVLFAGIKDSLNLWQVDSGAFLHRLAQAESDITALVLSRDGRKLAYATQKQGIQVLRR